MTIRNSLFTCLLVLLFISYCKCCNKPDKIRHLIFFVDHLCWKNTATAAPFWESVAHRIELAGQDREVKSVELDIFTIKSNGPDRIVAKTIDCKTPGFKNRPHGFSIEFVDGLKSKPTPYDINGTFHIIPTIELIHRAWKKYQRDTNRQIEVFYISEMLEQTDSLELSDDRYDFLLKSPVAINRSGVDKAMNDLQNNNSVFYNKYIKSYKESYEGMEIQIFRPNQISATTDYSRVENYWYTCFEKIGIGQDRVHFNDGIQF